MISVGTIIERPAPHPARIDQAKAVEDTAKKRPAERANEPALEERRAEKRPEPSSRPGVRPVREPVESRPETAKARTPRPKRPVAAGENKERKEKPAARAEAKKSAPRPKPAEEAPDPMASIRLVVSFKDGTKIERQMNEVLRFSVDKGVLTVISKDGAVGRYSMLDVARVTIE